MMANGAALMAMGKTRKETIGRTDAEIFPPESAAIIEAIDADVMASGEARLADEELLTAYGRTWWLANKSPYRDGHGKVIGLIGISRDITNIKKAETEKERLEARLRQSQRLESIGTLAGGIAHDFNNILAAIIGYADMAQCEIPRENPAYRMIGQVLKASNRAKELVQHILAFSRKTDRELGPVAMGAIVKEALQLLRASIPTTIDIRQHIDPDTGAILADPTQIHQIVINLCTNAAQAMEETGGRIEVAVKNVDLDPDAAAVEPGLKSGRYVKLSVGDTGPGIDPAHIHKIFDPYFTTKDVGKGSGMGLAVVHGIVQSHGGMIQVRCDSRLESGASFDLYFPRIQGKAAASPNPSGRLPTGEEHILLVDDEPMLLDIGTEMLHRLGYAVTTETGGVEALATFKADPDRFDLVMTDQTMPNLTGSELARAILAIRADLPIILCTGFSNLIDETEAKKLGIRAMVMKPLVKQDVADLIRTVLDDAQEHTPA